MGVSPTAAVRSAVHERDARATLRRAENWNARPRPPPRAMRSLAAQTSLILRNDLRLFWRDITAAKGRVFSSWGFLAVLFVLANAITIFVCVMLKQPPALVTETMLWLFFAFVMLGAA